MAGKPDREFFNSLIGTEVHFWTIIAYHHTKYNAQGQTTDHFLSVRCRCGIERIISYAALKNNRTKSCGCYKQYKAEVCKSQRQLYTVLDYYKRSAAYKSKVWGLTDKEATDLFQLPCAYCKRISTRIHKYNGNSEYMHLNGIDRIDNAKGYLPGNVNPCCRDCNRAKTNRTMEEFSAWVLRLKEFLPELKANLRCD